MPKDLITPSQQWNTQDQFEQSKIINTQNEQDKLKKLQNEQDFNSLAEKEQKAWEKLKKYEADGYDMSMHYDKFKTIGADSGKVERAYNGLRKFTSEGATTLSNILNEDDSQYRNNVREVKLREDNWKQRQSELNPNEYKTKEDVWNVAGGVGEVTPYVAGGVAMGVSKAPTFLGKLAGDIGRGAVADAYLGTLQHGYKENFDSEIAKEVGLGVAGQTVGTGLAHLLSKVGVGDVLTPKNPQTEVTDKINKEYASSSVENKVGDSISSSDNITPDSVAKKINDTYFGGKNIIPDAAPVRSDMPVIDNQEANKVNDFFNPVDKNRVQAQGNTNLPTPASQQDPFVYQPKQADTFGFEKDAQRNNEIQQLREKISPLNDTLKTNETNSLMGVKRENPNDISLPPMGTQKQLLPDVLPADRQEMLSVMQFAKDNNAVDEFISKLPPSARIDEVKQAFDRMPISQPKEDNLLPTMTPAEPRQTKSGILYSNGGQNLGGAFAGGAESEFNQKDYTQDGKHDYKDNIVGALVGILGVKGAKKIFPNAFKDKNIDGNTAGMFVGTKPSEQGAFSDIATKKVMKEIDDSKSTISRKGFNELFLKDKSSVGNVLEHNELFNKYPEMKEMPIYTTNGETSFDGHIMLIDRKYLEPKNKDALKSVILHELQHSVQNNEGWARGGNVKQFEKTPYEIKQGEYASYILDGAKTREEAIKLVNEIKEDVLKNINDPLYTDKDIDTILKLVESNNPLELAKKWKERDITPDNAFDKYQRLWGEQQARATQQRMNMTPEQRIKEDWTQTLANNEGKYNEPIIKYDSGVAMSINKDTKEILEKNGIKYKTYDPKLPESRIEVIKREAEKNNVLFASPTISGGMVGGITGANNDLNGDGKTNITDILIGAGIGAAGTKGALLAKNTNIAAKATSIIKNLADTETADKIFGHKIYQKTDYMNLREEMISGKNKQYENFALLHEQLKLLDDTTRTKMYNYMSGDKTIQLNPSIKQLADNYTNEINRMGKELVDLGVLEEAQFDKFKDRYLHRRYEKDFSQKFNSLFTKGKTIQGVHARGNEWNGTKSEYEQLLNDGKIGDFFAGKIEATRMQNGQYKFRQDWTEEQRTRWGEVKDIAFSLPETLMRTREMIDHAAMLKKIVDDTNYVSDDAIDGYVHLAGKRYGALNGKYVPADIASDIKEFNNALFGTEGSLLSAKGMEAFKALSTFWKKSHTVYNPIAHLNNLLSNVTMQFGAGINPNKAVVNATKGAMASQKVNQFRELTAKQIIGLSQEENATLRALAQDEDLKLWNQAQQSGLFGRSNLNDILNKYVNPNVAPTNSGKFKNTLQKADEIASNAYQGEDNIMRFSMLKSLTEAGTSFDDAIKQVNNTVPDYTKPMSQWARFGRDSMLTPFISWTYYATPIILKQMKERPERIAAIYGALYGMNQMFGIDPFNEKDIPQQNFSMKRIPIYKNGDEVTTIKVDRWIPHGDILSPLDFVKNLTSGGAWSPVKDIPRNQDSYFGGKITNKEGALKAYHLAKYGVQQITPDVIDNAYNLAESQFMEAKKRSTNAVTKPRTTAQELLKFLGINAMTYDKANQAKKAMRDKED